MPSIAIFGGSGFIGLNIVESLLSSGYEVINISRHPSPDYAKYLFSKNKCYREELCDITSTQTVENVLKKTLPDIIIQSCAITPRDSEEISELSKTIEVNCLSTLKLVELSKKYGVKHFIYLGSVAVYGDSCQECATIPECTKIFNPISVYDYSKYITDRLLYRYKRLTGYNITILRLGDAFGPWERFTESRHVLSAPTQVLKLLSKGENVFLPKEGKTGWIYSRDVGTAIVLLIKSKPQHSIYHLSNNTTWSIYDFACYISKMYPGTKVSIDPNKSNVSFFSEKDNGIFLMDNFLHDYGYNCKYGMRDAANDFIAWYKSIDRENLFI